MRQAFLATTLLILSTTAFAQTKTYSSYSPSTVSAASGREYTMGLSGDLSFLSSSGANSTIFRMDTMFGWNRDVWEAGPKLLLENKSIASVNATLLGVGGYGDYHFKQTSSYNLGATISLLVGNASGAITSGTVSATSSTNFNRVEIGGVFKWFALRSASTAFRFELLYQSTSTNGSTTGVVAKYGLQTYF